jgi:uncharacterized membrane protein YhaH (DUF805 family)
MQQYFNDYITTLKQYTAFNGRVGQRQFWAFTLINLIIAIILSFIGLLGLIYNLAVIVPSLGVTARRLHDINQSGWWMLLALIPLIGPIIVLVMCALKPVDEGNKYNAVAA